MTKTYRFWIIILLIVIGIEGALLFAHYYSPNQSPESNTASSMQVSQPAISPSPEPTVIAQQFAEPQVIAIPKINVNALIEPVGQDVEGKMDVPKGVFNVGWYNLGYKPGEKGSAVMAGHLDTVTGAPAVFYYLGTLVKGDEVIVTDKNGNVLTFVVTMLESYPFDKVPLQEIFDSKDKPRLNLVTCIGVWNVGTRNYSERLVIYTELKS